MVLGSETLSGSVRLVSPTPPGRYSGLAFRLAAACSRGPSEPQEDESTDMDLESRERHRRAPQHDGQWYPGRPKGTFLTRARSAEERSIGRSSCRSRDGAPPTPRRPVTGAVPSRARQGKGAEGRDHGAARRRRATVRHLARRSGRTRRHARSGCRVALAPRPDHRKRARNQWDGAPLAPISSARRRTLGRTSPPARVAR